jgi:RNA 3'-terminal phosphate cyclase (ATP)
MDTATAAAEVGRADLDGAHIGSSRLVFRPARAAAGDYTFSVGTAASATRVLETVLPALLVAKGDSKLGWHLHTPHLDFFKAASKRLALAIMALR